jgi:hypothetical protein
MQNKKLVEKTIQIHTKADAYDYNSGNKKTGRPLGMEEDCMGGRGTEHNVELEDKDGRSRKRGRGNGRGRRGIRRKRRRRKKNKNNNNTKKTIVPLQAFYTSCLSMLPVLIQTRRIKK